MNYTVKMEIEIAVNSDDGKNAREYAADVVKSLGIDCVKVLSAERVDNDDRRHCKDDLMQNAIDLITHQKAEKEALIAGQETLQKHIAEQKEEIERLQSMNQAKLDTIHDMQAEIEEYEKVVGKLGRKDGKVVCVLKGKETEYIPTSIANVCKKLAISKAKTEAIKEFAERLCEDRISNDPVVIAVKTEMRLMEGERK